MKIDPKEISVRDLVKGYDDNGVEGVEGYGGRLDIRPQYQREFVYEEKQRAAVIDTLTKGYPLNVMYWAVREDGDYEVIDGQQRTISICQFVEGDFSCTDLYEFKEPRYFENLKNEEQEKILNYPLTVYLCDGYDEEKLKWFETINIAGKELEPQELHNAVYSGTWVTAAKKYFSRPNSPAKGVGGAYLSGKENRQKYLETAIKWIAGANKIKEYMGKHQHDPDAEELWAHFQAVVEWIEKTFGEKKPRSEMKGVDWGYLYRSYKNKKLDPKKIQAEVDTLMEDSDVTKRQGIYPYVLTREEHYLSIRDFDKNMKRGVYTKQKEKCKKCKKECSFEEMEADHITPWSQGGKTKEENCQMLCKECNRRKSDK